jgi:hypothetical protein
MMPGRSAADAPAATEAIYDIATLGVIAIDAGWWRQRCGAWGKVEVVCEPCFFW